MNKCRYNEEAIAAFARRLKSAQAPVYAAFWRCSFSVQCCGALCRAQKSSLLRKRAPAPASTPAQARMQKEDA